MIMTKYACYSSAIYIQKVSYNNIISGNLTVIKFGSSPWKRVLKIVVQPYHTKCKYTGMHGQLVLANF